MLHMNSRLWLKILDKNDDQLFKYDIRPNACSLLHVTSDSVYVVGCVPAVRDVYEVLTAFVADMTVQDVCSRLHPRLLGIDERQTRLPLLYTCMI